MSVNINICLNFMLTTKRWSLCWSLMPTTDNNICQKGWAKSWNETKIRALSTQNCRSNQVISSI